MAATFPVQVDAVSGLLVATLAGASLTPVSGVLYLVAVANVHAAVGTPTLTGTGGFGVTWTQVATRADAGAVERLTVFRGVASSATAGVLTADFGGVAQTVALMVTHRCQSVNQTTNQGVVQSVSATQAASAAPTVTFAAFGAVFNIAVMFSMTSLSTTWTNSTAGWAPTPVVANTAGSLGGMFRAHAILDTVPVGTFGASGVTCSVGVELKVDATVAGPGDAERGNTPLVDSAYRTGFSGPLRGVQIGDAREDFMFGSGGPTNYPIGDPAGINALETTQSENVAMLQLRGYWPHKTQRDDAIGNPTPPSQVQHSYCILKQLLVPVLVGSRTLSIDCKMSVDRGASTRPQMIVKANPVVGLQDDITVTATAGTNWQTLTAQFTTIAIGAVEVWRFNRDRDLGAIWWDNLRII